MPDTYPASVIEKIPVAEAQTLLTVDVPVDVWSKHIRPSQYVDIVLPDMRPWHATIASRQGQSFFEFLVKDVGERSHRVSSLEVGDEFDITAPMGDGFPLLAYRRHNLILAACGVAICAMRPLIQDILLARNDWYRVMLFYSERTADLFAFLNEMEVWRENKIEIHLTASRPSEGTPWKGYSGYVQDLIYEIQPETDQAVAFVAGKDGMIEGVRDILARMNLPPNLVITNFP
jgi:NAD(P)H-flavin reductase